MRTGTLILLTVLFALVGIALIGGGIGYLIWDAKKQKKAAQRKARFQSPAGFAAPSQPSQGNSPASK
ncbi:MAG TPA: hypothetical protein PKY88_12970 [Anaerohalosphaeraceae bacterium]|nr:hypothetical protein [Anaerohalosphaeraceae bacterium]